MSNDNLVLAAHWRHSTFYIFCPLGKKCEVFRWLSPEEFERKIKRGIIYPQYYAPVMIARGVQYAASAYRKQLRCFHMIQSMSHKGDPYECEAYLWYNAVAENFFSFLKCELVHLTRFDSRPKTLFSPTLRAFTTLSGHTPLLAGGHLKSLLPTFIPPQSPKFE